jgi:hypothetical protein
MSEPTTNCSTCGKEIFVKSANTQNGRCFSCYHKYRLHPPDDFALPQDFQDQLITERFPVEEYRIDVWRFGLEKVRADVEFALNKFREFDAICAVWLPKLHDYEKQCRIAAPPPTEADLSAKDRAKQHIYGEYIRKTHRQPNGRRHQVHFCICPLLAIPVARRLWPGVDPRNVILTHDEREHFWNNIYTGPQSPHWWWVNYGWLIRDPPDPVHETPLEDGRVLTLGGRWIEKTPPGEEPWEVTYGVMWGGQHGDSKTDLWSWNGERAQFIEEYGVVTY